MNFIKRLIVLIVEIFRYPTYTSFIKENRDGSFEVVRWRFGRKDKEIVGTYFKK